jgi:response regulator RpfG family c-di-GMP phosphodiesterase
MKKILLASSSRQFLKRNTSLLNGRGLEIFSATRGDETLRFHEEHPVDLIIADQLLEDMEGSRLCALVNREKELRHVPLIFCCLDNRSAAALSERDGAVTLLLKPIDPVQLLEVISRLFDEQISRSKRVALQVKVVSKKVGLESICHSHDISNTGILVESDHLFDIGDQLVCRFTLPSSIEIETDGEVIRTVCASDGKTYCGIKFINIPFSQFKAIDEYVSTRPQLMKCIKGNR